MIFFTSFFLICHKMENSKESSSEIQKKRECVGGFREDIVDYVSEDGQNIVVSWEAVDKEVRGYGYVFKSSMLKVYGERPEEEGEEPEEEVFYCMRPSSHMVSSIKDLAEERISFDEMLIQLDFLLEAEKDALIEMRRELDVTTVYGDWVGFEEWNERKIFEKRRKAWLKKEEKRDRRAEEKVKN